MKPLPSEIISIIVHCLREMINTDEGHSNWDPNPGPVWGLIRVWEPSNLAQYSVISRQWQRSVEPFIWKRICLLGPTQVFHLFRYTTGDDYRCARVGYIRHIFWQPCIVLPDKTDPIFHTNSNHPIFEWYDNQYHNELRHLFLVLHIWGKRNPGLELVLYHRSPEYKAFRPSIPQDSSLRETMFSHSKTLPACLTEKHLEDFPSPSCVRSIDLLGTWADAVLLSSFRLIFNYLPNVRHASVHDLIYIPDSLGEIRLLLRQEMIDFIHHVPQSVGSLDLSVEGGREWSRRLHEDEVYHRRLTYLDHNGLDLLSIGLNTLSMQLRALTLRHMRISKALFWPSAESSTNASYWPNLEQLQVLNMPPYDIDGSPLLGLDPPLTREDLLLAIDGFSNRREYIKSANMSVLYQAIGQAARQMPRLDSVCLSLLNFRTGEESRESLNFSRDKNARTARLRISTQWEYRLGEEVISAWGLEGDVAEEFRRTMDVTLPWYVEPREDQ